MGSLLGDVGRALRSVRNAAPAPLIAPGSHSLTSLFTQTEHHLRAMGVSGTVFAIVNGLAEPTAGVKWRLYRSSSTGLAEDRKEVVRHQALKIWNRPNDFMPGGLFRHMLCQHLELVGEAGMLVSYAPGTGIPSELWPVRPDRLIPDPHPTEFMVGWNYRAPGSVDVPLGLDEVVRIVTPDPEDPYRGLGVIQSIVSDIQSSQAAAEWTVNFFHNNARPGGVVEIPGQLGEPQFNQLVDRWEVNHRGVRNANRVAFLEGGAKFIPGTLTQRDMQFVELRKATSEVIREAFRFPVPLLGTVDSVNRANADAAELMLARWLIVPRLNRIRDVLNTTYLALFGAAGVGLEFDYDSPVAADRAQDAVELTAKVNAFVQLVRSGVQPDDAADVVGLPRMRRAPIAAPSVPPAAGRAAIERRPVGCSHQRPTGQTDPRETDPTYQAYASQLSALLETWSELAVDVRADIVAAVRSALAEDPATLADVDVPSGAGVSEVVTALVAMYTASAGLAVADAADAGFEVDPAEMTEDAETLMTVLATGVVGVLVGALVTSAVAEALRLYAAGADDEAIADGVTTHLAALTDAYPEQKLGGLLWGAANAGRMDTAERSGLEIVYVADERLDAYTCKPCREVNGAVYYSADAMRADGYGFGGYTPCLGRDRCRGFARVAWNGETE